MNQHHVQEAYLKSFEDDSDKLWVYPKHGGKPLHRSAKQRTPALPIGSLLLRHPSIKPLKELAEKYEIFPVQQDITFSHWDRRRVPAPMSLRSNILNAVRAVPYCAALAIFGSSTCEANLGDTPEQIKARYGELIDKFGTETEKTFRFRRRGRDADTVDVRFRDGKSQWEAYHHWKSKTLSDIDSTGSFPTSEIDAILKENSRGLTWRKQARLPNDLPGSTTWLLGSNDPKTAIAKAVSNDEHHSLALWLLGYDLDGRTDATTAGKLDALFPTPTKSPEPSRAPVALKPGAFPLLTILGQPQSAADKLFGKPKNHRPIHGPDALAGGTEVEYADGTHWSLLSTAFHRGKLRWVNFFFREPLPASEAQLFEALGLPQSEFRKTSHTSSETKYRGVAEKRVISLTATHPSPRDPAGFCTQVDIELVEILD